MAVRVTDGDADLIFGRNAVLEAIRAGERPREVIVSAGAGARGALGEVIGRAERAGVPVRHVPRAALDRLVGSGRHQGVAARLDDYHYRDLDEIVAHAIRLEEPLFVLALDAVQDVHNLGGLIRSAEAAGVHGVLIPDREAAPVTAAVRKTSAGAVAHMMVARGDLASMLDRLRERGVVVIGLTEGAETAHTRSDLTRPIALVVGSEGRGLSRTIERRCDEHVGLPMRGRVGSLNAAVAGSIVVYEAVRQRGHGGSGTALADSD